MTMAESRTENALERLAAALKRIDAAKDQTAAKLAVASAVNDGGSERVLALINSHEKLREEVAETVRQLDAIIEEHGR